MIVYSALATQIMRIKINEFMRLHTQAQHTSMVVWSKDVVDTPTSEYLSVCVRRWMDGWICNIVLYIRKFL